MRFLAFCILFLTIGEPLLVLTNKVVLVIPQQNRRSFGPPWRPGPMRYRKSSHDGEHYHKYYSPPIHYHKRPGHGNVPFPHGGDDFDQGHEQVNHVHIPYGKGIRHAISYGKGYIPYDRVKDALSYGRGRPGSQEYKHSDADYEATSFTSSGSDYSLSGHSYESPSTHSYESSPSETYYTNADNLNYNERRNDEKKFYTSRSIEKNLAANSAVDYNGAVDKDELFLLQQKPELYKNVSPVPQGGVVMPTGIPSATIGGSKEGIVLRDSVALDEYQQKLQEMTKSWPQFFSNSATTMGNNYNQQLTGGYSLTPSSNFGGSFGWTLNYAQPKGYDVKEEVMEQPQDFRTMPIQTNQYQTYSVPMNMVVPSVVQTVHG
ncbi:uncharacterized protein LOC105663222 [Megachile rotundata]|uniref:uncharacterized protein LOC105663222 n=1 Tax=Megachile rotundata TaxID=143995 RepID=UPI003FD66FA9